MFEIKGFQGFGLMIYGLQFFSYGLRISDFAV